MSQVPPLLRRPAFFIAAVLYGVACNSDDLEQSGSTTTSATTEQNPTEVPTFTTGEPVDSTSTTEVPVPERTCRWGVTCSAQCATQIPNPTPPEYNWQECFFDDCLEKLTAEEWLKFFDLAECVVMVCSARPECIEGGEMCNLCYIQMLAVPPLYEGCDAQAAACD
ncbi:hypothetical protein [Nannocystis punicea]|uniref:Secreted protein n=1 Tax=Nannocystis punicea TaxID=2995304 RepID=A0ABY7H0I7_9BACT|nr:hypothetical protein [Nannocystis poenicansa]WAS92760.1 hypothetical protein O0S08_41830 [Nannocystis poenicansa]